MKKYKLFLLNLLTAILWCSPTLASDSQWWLPADDMGKQRYAGLQFSSNEVALLTGRQVQGDVTIRMSADNSATSYGLVLGANYNRYMKMEMRYQNLGTYTHQLEYVDARQSVQASVDSELESRALSFVMRPHYLLGRGFSLEAEAGLAYARLTRDSVVSVSGKKSQQQLNQLEQELQNSLGSASDQEFGLTYGVAMRYQKSNSPWQWRYFIQGLDLEEETSLMGLGILRDF